jgi:hydrogenase expression/formation protein HypE
MEALLEVAQASGVGIEAAASRFPTDPAVSRFAEAFGFDPLWMLSSGALVATVPPDRQARVSRVLGELDVPFGFVGQVTSGTGVLLTVDGQARRFEAPRCETDELARLWARYPREA